MNKRSAHHLGWGYNAGITETHGGMVWGYF